MLAVTHGFHGRTAAAAAVTWNSERWYGFPVKPFETDFIPRDDAAAARAMIGPDVGGIAVMPTFHPAYLLRQYTPDNRRKVWSDLQAVMQRLGLPTPSR